MAGRKPGGDRGSQPLHREARDFRRGVQELVAPLQFDVFVNPSTRGTEGRPYVVVVQANILKGSHQRLVMPLVVEHEIKPLAHLNSAFDIEGKRVYLQPLEIAALPTRVLQKHISNLEEFRSQIVRAIDLVLIGI